ncbi:MAG: SDR family oxidoreductase [Acidobacteriota bacterium]|nr:SDR family oxidoreductase [Acidobacteriota bacterium]
MAQRPTALVTGASSGIGRELAVLLARDGHDLVLVARDAARLEALARELFEAHGTTSTVLPLNLSAPDGPFDVLAEVRRAGIELDVLVNNAGIGVWGFFAEADLARELEMIRVNVIAVTVLAKAVLPEMLARGSGRILNVASTAAFQPGPLMAVYYGTKAYVLSFSEAIANETAGTGVTVTAFCPGPTITEFQKKAGMEQTRLFRSRLVQDARTAAKAGYEGMKRGKRVVVPGIANKILAQGVRFAPRRLLTAVTRRIQETRG